VFVEVNEKTTYASDNDSRNILSDGIKRRGSTRYHHSRDQRLNHIRLKHYDSASAYE
jgi:hypothetical protein